MTEQETKLKNYVFEYTYQEIYNSLPEHVHPGGRRGTIPNTVIIWDAEQESRYNNNKYDYEETLTLDQ